jgi:hypothetical protein
MTARAHVSEALAALANVVTGALRAAAAIRDGGEPPSQFLPWVEKQLRVTLPYAGRR